jgi:putative ABC transport system permease protein
MSTTLPLPIAASRPGNGGAPARRAVARWAWRLFKREWRQQLLIVALIVVAVGATILGAAVATNTPQPNSFGFGTAQDLATYQGLNPQVAGQISGLQHRFGRTDVIENETFTIPGSINTYNLRAQNPHGPFGQPMLALLSGHYPTGAGQVAVTPGVASDFNLKVGDLWHQGGARRRVVGLVDNPQSLLDEFALVVPGQVHAPTQVSVLFDAHGVRASSIGRNVETPASVAQSNPLNPQTISLAVLTIGMLLIAIMAVGGFTVLAQRRLRSLGMLASLGAPDKLVGFVVRANGLVVGVVGAAIGTALGLVGWLAYRPSLEASSHHVIGVFALPWLVVALAIVLAVVATYFAASRPARAITRLPVVSALSGRPAPPRQVHRSALPGIVFLVIAFLLLGYSGAGGGATPRAPELVLGLVALIPGVILLSPFCLTLLARLGRSAPIAVRLPLRDLSRYRARSGSALSAISIGVLVAVIIVIVAAARYGNVLDYAGPNVASNQLIVYTPGGQGGPGSGQPTTAGQLKTMEKNTDAIAASLGSHDVIALEQTSANLSRAASGRNFTGQIYVATPQLLKAFGIKASQVDPTADILTMRPGLSGLSKMQLSYGNPGGNKQYPNSSGSGPGNGGNQTSPGCDAKNGCLANPTIQQVGSLPAGTSAPNTVITEYAVHKFHLQTGVAGWLIQSPSAPTAAQISSARTAASLAGMTIETKNSQPSSATIINWATIFGIALALGILAMSVGLIRSETSADLRTLASTGASSSTRRTLTAVTAGALGLLGAVLGTVAGYVGVIGWIRTNSLNGGISALGSVPVENLLLILVGMPLVAALAGWLLAGRQPVLMAHQPLE